MLTNEMIFLLVVNDIFRIKPKLDELGSLHARHLLRPTLDDRCEEEELIEELSQEISKLICSTHRHIQCIRSSIGNGKNFAHNFELRRKDSTQSDKEKLLSEYTRAIQSNVFQFIVECSHFTILRGSLVSETSMLLDVRYCHFRFR